MKSDSNGIIDFDGQAPIDGYNNEKNRLKIVDSFGLLWSMQQVSIQSLTASYLHDGDVKVRLLSDLNNEVIKMVAVQDENVEKIAVLAYPSIADGVIEISLNPDEVQFKGILYLPKSTENMKVPAVILLHGSDGKMPVAQARYYASKGIAAISVQYFTFDPSEVKPYLTDSIRSTPLEIVEHAIDYLSSRPEIDKSKIVVQGGSRGGEMALLVGVHFGEKLAGIIAERPSHYAFGSKLEVQRLEEKSSWSLKGEDIPYVSLLNKSCIPTYLDEITDLEGGRVNKPINKDLKDIEVYRFRDGFKKVFENNAKCGGEKNTIRRGKINTRKIKVPLMITAGDNDLMWLANNALRDIQKERKPLRMTKDRFLLFPKAGHTSGIPGISKNPPWSIMPFSYKPDVPQSIWAYGGTPKENHEATLKVWTECLAFLESL